MLSGKLLVAALRLCQVCLRLNLCKVADDMLQHATASSPHVPWSQVPVAVLWGAADPWEKVEWGRDFCPANYPAIEVLLIVHRNVHRLNCSCHVPYIIAYGACDIAMCLAGLHRAPWRGPLSNG